MENETKMKLIQKLTKLKLMSKMYQYTFNNASDKMDAKALDELLDAKLKADKQIELLEKVLKELEK